MALFVPVNAVKAHAQDIFQPGDRATERHVKLILAILCHVGVNSAFEFIARILCDIADRTGKGRTAIERALRTLDDLDSLHVVEQARVREHTGPGLDCVFGRRVNAIDENSDLGPAARVHQTADRDSCVGRRE